MPLTQKNHFTILLDGDILPYIQAATKTIAQKERVGKMLLAAEAKKNTSMRIPCDAKIGEKTILIKVKKTQDAISIVPLLPPEKKKEMFGRLLDTNNQALQTEDLVYKRKGRAEFSAQEIKTSAEAREFLDGLTQEDNVLPNISGELRLDEVGRVYWDGRVTGGYTEWAMAARVLGCKTEILMMMGKQSLEKILTK